MDDVVRGLAWLAVVSGGFYAVLLLWAARTGRAHPASRARVAGTVSAVVAVAGAVALILAG